MVCAAYIQREKVVCEEMETATTTTKAQSISEHKRRDKNDRNMKHALNSFVLLYQTEEVTLSYVLFVLSVNVISFFPLLAQFFHVTISSGVFFVCVLFESRVLTCSSARTPFYREKNEFTIEKAEKNVFIFINNRILVTEM